MRRAKMVPLAVLVAVMILTLLVRVRGRARLFDGAERRADTGAAAPPLAVPPSTTISVAKLSGAGIPDNCADVTFAAGKTIDVEGLKARGFVVLRSTCAESFARLGALASCARSSPEGAAQPTARGIAYYYDLATLEGDDTYRGQCLGTGGTWQIKPQSDPQVASARARAAGATPHHEIDSLMELMP
jgi:hypothetical protein